jgi:hypothetical protein
MLNRAKSAADRILARYGGEAELVRLEAGTEPEFPWDPPAEDQEVYLPVQAIETGSSSDYLGDTLIEAGDVVCVIASDTEPRLSDKLRLRGHDHVILDIKPVQPAPGGPLSHYSIHARR